MHPITWLGALFKRDIAFATIENWSVRRLFRQCKFDFFVDRNRCCCDAPDLKQNKKCGEKQDANLLFLSFLWRQLEHSVAKLYCLYYSLHMYYLAELYSLLILYKYYMIIWTFKKGTWKNLDSENSNKSSILSTNM